MYILKLFKIFFVEEQDVDDYALILLPQHIFMH